LSAIPESTKEQKIKTDLGGRMDQGVDWGINWPNTLPEKTRKAVAGDLAKEKKRQDSRKRKKSKPKPTECEHEKQG